MIKEKWNVDESGLDGRSPFTSVRVVGKKGANGKKKQGVVATSHRDHYTLVVAVCSDGSHCPVTWITKTTGGQAPSARVAERLMEGCTPGAQLYGSGACYYYILACVLSLPLLSRTNCLTFGLSPLCRECVDNDGVIS